MASIRRLRAAPIVGVLAWCALMRCASWPGHATAQPEGAQELVDDAKQHAQQARQAVKEQLAEGKQALHEAKQKVKAEVDAVRERAAAAKAQAHEEVHAAEHQVAQDVEAAKQQGQQALDEARERMHEARQQLLDKAHQKLDEALAGGDQGDAQAAQRARDARRAAFHDMHAHVKRPAEIPPEVRQALRVHAQRSARLARIRALAEQAGDSAAVARTDTLIAKERAQHHGKLARFWQLHGAPGAPTAEGEDEEPEEPAAPEEESPEDEP